MNKREQLRNNITCSRTGPLEAKSLELDHTVCTGYMFRYVFINLQRQSVFIFTDLLGDQSLANKEGSDEEMETKGSDESDMVGVAVFDDTQNFDEVFSQCHFYYEYML